MGEGRWMTWDNLSSGVAVGGVKAQAEWGASTWCGCPVWGIRIQRIRRVYTFGRWLSHGSQSLRAVRTQSIIQWPRTVWQSAVRRTSEKRHRAWGVRAQAGWGGLSTWGLGKNDSQAWLKSWGRTGLCRLYKPQQGKECPHGARDNLEWGVRA